MCKNKLIRWVKLRLSNNEAFGNIYKLNLCSMVYLSYEMKGGLIYISLIYSEEGDVGHCFPIFCLMTCGVYY